MKGSRTICRIALLTALSTALVGGAARAQSAPSAFGPGKSLWAGAGYSSFSASFPYQSGQRVSGPGAFIDYHLNSRLTLEAEARFLRFGGFETSTESSYLAGPKFFVFERGKYRPYGKALVGLGRIHYPFTIGSASYLAVAPGAGMEYRLSRRLMLHLDYEYQFWLNSPGYASEPDHPLHPNGFQIGVAYRIFR